MPPEVGSLAGAVARGDKVAVAAALNLIEDRRPQTRPRIEELLAAINQRTVLLVLSHVLFRTAELIDVRPFVQKAHEYGALVCLDAYQSMGAVPFDYCVANVRALQ